MKARTIVAGLALVMVVGLGLAWEANRPAPDGCPAGYFSSGPCALCFPRTRAALPPPIRWQPCAPEAYRGPLQPPASGSACREMERPWTSALYAPERIAAVVRGAPSADGGITLQLGRLEDTHAWRLVADADGPVHQAIFEPSPAECALGHDGMAEGRVAWRVYRGRSEIGTALAGAIDDLAPRSYGGDARSLHPHYVPARAGLIELTGSGLRRFAWDSGADLGFIVRATDEGRAQSFALAQAGALFWTSEGDGVHAQRLWTDTGGARDLITFGADRSRGARNLGSDGQVLVWQQGSGGASGGGFLRNEVFTAPLTLDPGGLQPRRVRSDGAMISQPFVVGCGYAAHASSIVPDEVGILLVRLADGRAWTLTTRKDAAWVWSQAVALSCTELFATVRAGTPQTFNVVRVRLDALGPGTAPD